MEWINLAQDRNRWLALVNVESGNELSGSIKCGKFFG
jgi:hypothetical protein